MAKQGEKKKKNIVFKTGVSNAKLSKKGESIAKKAYDKDTEVFISVSQERKEEGNKLFQKRNHEGALLNYEKALNLLPSNHADVPYLHTNIAACYMERGLHEYPTAIQECNLALEMTPNYTKALLKRARCYEALNRLEYAIKDSNKVLKIDPNNLMAAEILERAKERIEKKDSVVHDKAVDLIPLPEYFDPHLNSELAKKNKNKKKSEKKKIDEDGEKKSDDASEEQIEEKKVNWENAVDGSVEVKKYDEQIKEKKVDKEQIKEKKLTERKRDDQIQEDNVKKKKFDEKVEERKIEEQVKEKNAEDKLVVKEKISTNILEEESKITIKLVFGEDIRWAKIPINCDIFHLREIIHERFPNSKAVHIKYRDQEGDLVTITTNEELRWAESMAGHTGSTRLHVVEVDADQDPLYDKVMRIESETEILENGDAGKFQETECIDDWILQFAQLFLKNVGVDSDGCLDIHELGMKLYTEAMEETVTSEEAQGIFESAAGKFQEMAALSLFNWGNVHMSRARKRVFFKEDSSKDSILEQIKIAYDWAQAEYSKAGQRYEEALKIKPDFYEGVVALGQQQFEQAKLSWYHAISTNMDLENFNSAEVIQLYNSAEDNIEKGMQMWELVEEARLNEISRPSEIKEFMVKMDMNGWIKDLSDDEAADQTANMRSQIYVLWGTILYERSIMEYKLGLPVWQECLEASVENFELAGASSTDLAVMIKNHCSNCTELQGLGFNIDEIVQAWNEMYDAKRWQRNVPSFRLEPLLRRRVSNLYHALQHA